jgi:hypothetical protein
MFRVRGVQEASRAPCIVKIDSYVPISFRSRHQPVAGARYIRLGNFETQLVELQFPSESLALSGFTLVLAEASAQGPITGDGPAAAGLPIISLLQGEAFESEVIPRLDIETNVTVFCANDQADVSLGTAETFNHSIVHGRVQFLLSDDVLAGLRIIDLTEREQQILRACIAERPAKTAG